MEVCKLNTTEDLATAWLVDERLELINGEIVKRPMARFKHGRTQGEVYAELRPFGHKSDDSGGWWFATEVNVRYNEHQSPCHDIAGWRKSRAPQQPSGVVSVTPDWVCEITSPGHEKKDTLHNFVLLQKYQIPYYWIIWPEDRVLVAYKLVDGKYFAIDTIDACGKAHIEPFSEIAFDLDVVLGD